MTEFYLSDSNRRKLEPRILIRNGVVIKGRAAITDYRSVPLYKQFFKLMEYGRNNEEYFTKGEIVAILKRKLGRDRPSYSDLKQLNTELTRFRKWFGRLHMICAYGESIIIPQFENYGKQLAYRPILKERDYMRIAGKHIANVIAGLRERHEDNLTIVRLTKKEADKRIQEASKEIDIEAQFGSGSNSNSNNKKGSGGKRKGKK